MMNIRIIPILLTFSLILSSALPIVHANEETTASSPDDTTESEEKEDADASDTDCAVVEKSGPEKEVSPGSTSDETDAPTSGESAGAVTDFETKTGDGPENTPTLEKADDSIIDAPSTGIPVTDTFSTAPNTDDVSSFIEAAPIIQVSEPSSTTVPSITTTKTTMASATASVPHIILSEIQISGGTGKSNNDFVELYNRFDESVILNDTWSLVKRTGSKNSDGTITTKEETIVKFPANGTCLPPKGTLLWINSEADASYLALKGPSDISNSKYLTNTNGIALIHNGKPIDAIQFPAAISEPFDESAIIEDPGSGSISRNLEDYSWNKTPSPSPTGSEEHQCEIIPVPTVGTIVINELYPNPTAGENEWIELRNTTDADASIAGWKLKDASTSAGFTFPTGSNIGAHGFLVVGADISKIALNNTGTESLILLFPNGSVADTFSYADTEQGASYARTDSGTFLRTHTPTKGEANSFDLEPEIPENPPIGTVIISEFLPHPTNGEEWIEIRNNGNAEIPLAGWILKDASSGNGYAFPKGSTIAAEGYLVIAKAVSGIALNDAGTESVSLLFPDKAVADTFTYVKTELGASYARDENGAFRITHTLTPGTSNAFDSELDPPIIPPPGTIRINEVFPNPKEKGEANEWIELRNSGSEPVSLLGWTLRSGSGRFTWTEKLPDEQTVIPAGGFLVLPRSLTRLALRNTNGTLSLVAPDGVTTMDSVTYDKTTEGASYGLFESARFRWSKTLTPGSDNVFGKEPNVKKSTIPKKGYRGVLVPFSATGNKKGMKYAWDFGDGHKSYLEATSHRFVKTGTYEGSLTLRDGIEETVKPFTIRIGKYPNRNIHLTELCPNPAGNDTGNEWVRIRNDDTKRIDLSGWIIASATEKTKLVNHVILTDRTIGPGEEIVLTRADSRFTLPNERAVIELRRPDGKAVQTIEYVQDGGATENAVFTEIDDSVWTWSAPETDRGIPMLSSADNETESDDIEEVEPFEAGMSADLDSDRLTFGEFVSLGTPYDPVLPDSLPRVLGASDERLTNEGSTSESFLDALFRMLNGLLYVEKNI
ncbi:MAG: hypothetical protein HGA33_03650 [Candidatus Moranbacteria bacterium]|nr:hypothetical protein [Candidatus Moranbacteria bacterium]